MSWFYMFIYSSISSMSNHDMYIYIYIYTYLYLKSV